ncbi:aspartyl-phosphate phosphatase Spo0E family protein [Cytobacillus praedii]|uniref:aspartyl-phosphate phosphatase Spo0E family protein n=1 Tax=Cytobacillus praedii TaxID=1742358 RepID=UPI002E1F01BC|nr:aspartyl-phosphate phosphatase Spo0E family protein [Cytobacillus praedii]
MKCKNIDAKIENLRSELYKIASKEGFNSPITIYLSQKLDLLINLSLNNQNSHRNTKTINKILHKSL